MDPLTHTLTGVLLSRAGLNRLTPHATAILVLAANAPDIDVVTWAGGSIAYLNFHRHLTHALAMIPVVAVLPVLVVALLSRRRLRWRRAWLVSLTGVATHPLLDLTNVYAIRLALPFSAEWFRLDITHVVDAWIWGVLLLAVLAPLLSRLVSQEMGAHLHPGRGWAWFGLAFLLLYNAGRAVLHERAVATLESRLYRETEPLRVAAFPDPFSPLRWRGLVETREFFALPEVRLGAPFEPRSALILRKPPSSPAIERARQDPLIRDFLRFAHYPLWSEEPVSSPEGTRVSVRDLRFGGPNARGFAATVWLDPALRVRRAEFGFDRK